MVGFQIGKYMQVELEFFQSSRSFFLAGALFSFRSSQAE